MLNPWPEMQAEGGGGRRGGGQPHPQSFHVCHLVSLGGLTQITIWKLHEASISAAESIQNGVCNWEFPNHSRQGWVKDVLLLIHPANNNNPGHGSASSPFARYSSLRLELVLSGPRIWIIWIFPRGNQHDPLAKRLQRRSPYQIPVSCENSCAPVEAIMRIRTQKEKAQHVTQKHIAAHRSTSQHIHIVASLLQWQSVWLRGSWNGNPGYQRKECPINTYQNRSWDKSIIVNLYPSIVLPCVIF